MGGCNDGLASAEALCVQRGARLTPLRQRVLEIVLEAGGPLGAYAILDRLRADGRPGAPPTVYRALEFLLEQGLVHRLASMNVYVGCCRPARCHGAQFLICEACGEVVELEAPQIEKGLTAQAAGRGFAVRAQVVEVLGRCAGCRAGGQP